MEKYQLTSTWKNTLGSKCSENQTAINRLKDSFISFRENVVLLSNEISRSLPEYTVHDITHIDALWEMADCICGSDYDLTPVEGYVLGGAFLLHDLAMSLAAYPCGIKDLEKLPMWSDTVAQRCSRQGIPIPDSISSNTLPEDIREFVISTVLRKLHASSAEKLALTPWQSTQGDVFLIDNPEIRQTFGRVIGKIAHSHWWDISKLEHEFSRTIGAPSWCPRQWTIDPLKLSCILRVSDASHIDSRRAPQFLRTLRKLSPSSDEHWCFQEKLQKPYLSEDSLFYTSGHSFKSSEASSWWLCYEALKMIDKELRQTDALLADHSMNRFSAKRVFGIESPERLSSLIQTDGWAPIDAFVHIGDLPKIIRNLGGEELYGRDLTVPIRELIQNSSDAIRARRKLENRNGDWGCIKISRLRNGDDEFIQVEDNGIGMSLDVIKNYLFDFGTSYWGSELMLEEHPGLMTKDINVTGKYGIGFFSSFMFGDDIQITTRKCTSAQGNTHVIEFKGGLDSRPIIRNASPDEYLLDGGTRIKIRVVNKDILNKLFKKSDDKKLTLQKLCLAIAPALDVEMLVCEYENEITIPKDNWIKCTSQEFVKLLSIINDRKRFSDEDVSDEFLEKAAHNVREIYNDDHKLIGRGFLGSSAMGSSKNSPTLGGHIVVGGLVESSMSGINGIFIGNNKNAARNDSKIIASEESVAEWVSEQAKLVSKLYNSEALVSISQLVRILKGKADSLPIAIYDGVNVNCQQINDIIGKLDKVIIADDFFLKYSADNFDALVYEPNIFFTEISGVPSVFHNKNGASWGRSSSKRWNFDLTCSGYIVEIISKVWEIPLDKCIEIIDVNNKKHELKIATNNGKEIKETAYLFDKSKLIEKS
ncbi:ATP-binding protein [Shewanella putrefaciens]|uniref:HD domain-containing protein n=1 Tax=Shewanella putrefaciens TaxID=24 RepID=UPI0018E8EFB6|nr:ATP-binding protein [Shewanella putrefaciens]